MLNSILAARNDRAGEETTTQQPLQSNYPGVLHILRSGERSRASQNLPRAICAASNGSGGLRSPLALSGSGAVDGTRMLGGKKHYTHNTLSGKYDDDEVLPLSAIIHTTKSFTLQIYILI